jgi:hypothetical protein
LKYLERQEDIGCIFRAVNYELSVHADNKERQQARYLDALRAKGPICLARRPRRKCCGGCISVSSLIQILSLLLTIMWMMNLIYVINAERSKQGKEWLDLDLTRLIISVTRVSIGIVISPITNMQERIFTANGLIGTVTMVLHLGRLIVDFCRRNPR